MSFPLAMIGSHIGAQRAVSWLMMALLLVYLAVELGWGGGDPNDPAHNPPKGQ